MATFTTKLAHVNSQRVFEEVNSFIADEIRDLDVIWDSPSSRDAALSLLDEWMQELVEGGLITQYKVICDKRNNTIDDEDDGVVNLDIEYVQYNCLNRTKISYRIFVGFPDGVDPEYALDHWN